MIGTIVNMIVILLSGMLGNQLKRGIPKELRNLIMQILGLCVIVIGMRMALAAENDLVIVISIALGALVGYACHLDKKMNCFGERVKKLVRVQDNDFVDGFVSASLIFCVGSMAIVGAFEAALNHNYTVLFTKSALDGIMAIVLASSMGIGVAFSAFAVLMYQGALTLLAGFLSPVLTAEVVGYLSACGGVMIMAIGLTTAGIKEINTINLLPGLLFVAIIGGFMPLFT